VMAVTAHEMIGMVGGGTKVPLQIVNGCLGGAVVFVALFGIKGMAKMASLMLPLLIAMLLYAFYVASGTAGNKGDVEEVSALFRGEGLTMVLATVILFVVDIPTYYRFSCSKRDSYISIALLLGVVVPIIEGVGAFLGSREGSSELIDAFVGGGSSLSRVTMGLLLLIAGWTTNNANLYSATVAMTAIAPRLNFSLRTLTIGAVGVGVAIIGMLDNLEVLLQSMGIVVCAMGAVITGCYLASQVCTLVPEKALNGINLMAWVLSLSGGALAALGVMSISGVPIVDAFVIGCGASLMMNTASSQLRLMRKKQETRATTCGGIK
jgi:cytosine permease